MNRRRRQALDALGFPPIAEFPIRPGASLINGEVAGRAIARARETIFALIPRASTFERLEVCEALESRARGIVVAIYLRESCQLNVFSDISKDRLNAIARDLEVALASATETSERVRRLIAAGQLVAGPIETHGVPDVVTAGLLQAMRHWRNGVKLALPTPSGGLRELPPLPLFEQEAERRERVVRVGRFHNLNRGSVRMEGLLECVSGRWRPLCGITGEGLQLLFGSADDTLATHAIASAVLHGRSLELRVSLAYSRPAGRPIRAHLIGNAALTEIDRSGQVR